MEVSMRISSSAATIVTDSALNLLVLLLYLPAFPVKEAVWSFKGTWLVMESMKHQDRDA